VVNLAKQGERIELETENGRQEGVFVKEDHEFMFIKLKSGYNIGVAKRNVKGIKSMGEPERKHATDKHITTQKNNKLPTVALLHTGGTIASKVDYETGAVVAKFTPDEIIGLFPDLGGLANISSRLVSNIMSENMRFYHYNLILHAVVEEAKKGADGVIITHGTDTLHYTAAALSFALENLQIPVVIIGSQRSSDRPSTDSAVNLLCAATFITQAKMPGVFICLHDGPSDDTCIILEGVSARKMHSSRRDAFRPINKSPIAKVDYTAKSVQVIREKAKPKGDLKVNPFNENIKVGIAKVHPQMFADELAAYEKFDGLIIEGTGLGHGEILAGDDKSEENKKIKAQLEKLSKKIPVAMTTQTIYGRVNMNVYSPGRDLLDMGVIGNYCDMTPETAFVKLAWLLSNYKGQAKIKELFEKNLRGEISERSEKETFLI